MNLIRGFLSIGIILACLLDWVDIETKMFLFSLSGLKWMPSIILLYASILTAGYAFYNSYRNFNQNSWIYPTCGLYGVGVSAYIYLAVIQNVNIIYEFVPNRQTSSLAFNFGPGIYLTGLLSFLLFLTGFAKTNNPQKETQAIDIQQNSPITQLTNTQSKAQEKLDKPSLQEWIKANPGKSINEYFSNYK
ncbi:MAG: hypothetical protein JNL40_01240 [Cyclobacteriaceae bacterium]|nr:hypothetical protein [Cyclobacteriaceae bacterium]